MKPAGLWILSAACTVLLATGSATAEDRRIGTLIAVERTVPISYEKCARNYQGTDAVFGFGGICQIPLIGKQEKLLSAGTVKSVISYTGKTFSGKGETIYEYVEATLDIEGEGIAIKFKRVPLNIWDSESNLTFDFVRRSLDELLAKNPDVTLTVQTIERD